MKIYTYVTSKQTVEEAVSFALEKLKEGAISVKIKDEKQGAWSWWVYTQTTSDPYEGYATPESVTEVQRKGESMKKKENEKLFIMRTNGSLGNGFWEEVFIGTRAEIIMALNELASEGADVEQELCAREIQLGCYHAIRMTTAPTFELGED